jgi:NADP-dependent 3-hydroxy acid dehydrogenase YdfG
MTRGPWLITCVSSGFGRELTSQLLNRGDRVISTVRDTAKIADLTDRFPDTFSPETLQMTDSAAEERPDHPDLVLRRPGGLPR